MKTCVAVLAVLALEFGACSTLEAPTRDDISATVEGIAFIPAPNGGVFGGMAWLPSQDRLAVVYDPPNGRNGDAQIFTVGLRETKLRPLALPDDLPCLRTGHVAPRALADGRLAYVQGCVGSIPRVPQEANALMAFDFASGQASRLFPYYLHANQAQYALAPDLHAGVISDGNGLHEQLLWLRPSGTAPVERLSFERVWSPSWSPDGRSIALFAAVSGAGVQGLARQDLPWGIYVLDAQAANPRLLLQTGSGDIGGVSWSPDSRWLLCTFSFQNNDAPALWLVDVGSGRASLVITGQEQPGAVAWLPDGRTIIVSIGTRSRQPILLPGRTPAARVGLAVLKLPAIGRM